LRRWLAISLLLVPLALAAQEEERRGFFGRIFGSEDEEVQEESRGFLGRLFRGSVSRRCRAGSTTVRPRS
jgi:hypothetical protein